MASGINNTFRLGGVAMGVAALGAVLESRVASSLSAVVGSRSHRLGEAVSAAGLRAVGGQPALVHPARVAFVSGLNVLLLIGCATLVVGAVAAALLLRVPSPAPTPVAEPTT
jgi:DHA2 family multidrug resistance protein-like MFS transporter